MLIPRAWAQTQEPLFPGSTVWFLEFESRPAVAGTTPAALVAEQEGFRAAAAEAGIRYEERFAFHSLVNGLSVVAAPSDVVRLSRLTGVRAVHPLPELTLNQQRPDLASALETTGAAFVQNTLGFTGRGVRIAIIDTGIDYHHPDLGGCFGPGCKVVGGFDYVGDSYGGSGSMLVPDTDPDDHCNGHGTHVAGIAAGNAAGPDGVTGVAPGAELLAYRVFGCSGTTSSDVVIAAMEQAVADGANVINLSLGSERAWPNSLYAIAAARVREAGVVIVASIGNSGSVGAYGAGIPGVAADVIAVASFENERITLPVFRISPDDAVIGFQSAAGAPPAPQAGTVPLARTGTRTSTADACTALPAGSLAGTVALIRRGTCSFYIKALNAQQAGAVGVVIYNNAAGRAGATVAPPSASDPAIAIPVVTISEADGELIDARLAAGPVSLTWTDEVALLSNAPGGGLIAGGSSYGPPPDLSIKPDLGAPGGSVRSTYPLELGGYATLSGTSMASPHVTGAVALLLEALPGITPEEVRTRLLNTANPRAWSGNPALGFVDLVHRQGAGMLNIADAISATTLVTPDALALGEIESGAAVRTLTIRNSSSETVTYTLGHLPALTTTGTYPVAGGLTVINAPAVVSFGQSAVTIAAGGTASIGVTITPAASLPDRGFFGGYLLITPSSGSVAYSVPYSGLKGDYQSIPVLTSTPALGKWNGLTCTTTDVTLVFSMTPNDRPCIVAHFDHPSNRLLVYLTTADGGLLARAVEVNYVPRNQTAAEFSVINWAGVGVRGSGVYVAPNGTYRFRVQVLRALGSPRVAGHTEEWTSPAFTIARP